MPKSRVLIVAPGKAPVISWVDLTLEWMQKTVGGYIEAIFPFDDPVAIVCNDDGKNNGSLPNRALWHNGKILDIVYGTFIIVGNGREDFISLSKETAFKYHNLFQNPERFVRIGNQLAILKDDPGKQTFMR